MSAFCSLEEAFTGPVVAPGDKKKKKKDRQLEQFVPTPLAGAPDPDRITAPAAPPEPMRGAPQAQIARLDAGAATLGDFFPLPGESAEPEEWQKAFMLEGSQAPAPVPPKYVRPDGSVPVNGQPTLWRNIPAPAVVSVGEQALAPVTSDVMGRLDKLTRDLESLTMPTPVQSTAELFLFVAIGLLLLLAIDTLLRFATSLVTRQKGGYRMRGGARSMGRRLVWVR